MRKKIMKVTGIGTRVLPFVVLAIGIAEWIATKDANVLHISCLWGVIGCLEWDIHLLEEKVNGIIH